MNSSDSDATQKGLHEFDAVMSRIRETAATLRQNARVARKLFQRISASEVSAAQKVFSLWTKRKITESSVKLRPTRRSTVTRANRRTLLEKRIALLQHQIARLRELVKEGKFLLMAHRLESMSVREQTLPESAIFENVHAAQLMFCESLCTFRESFCETALEFLESSSKRNVNFIDL